MTEDTEAQGDEQVHPVDTSQVAEAFDTRKTIVGAIRGGWYEQEEV